MSQRSELQITDAEWEVMQSVWEAEDQTAGEIIARTETLRDRSHRTIRTLLARLVEKGAVDVHVEGSRHLYRAAVTRNECVRSAAHSFSERFFSGNLQSLLMHFVENETLSSEELAELRQTLDARLANQRPPEEQQPSGKPTSRRRKTQ
ncbi:BlaI/MecI/CopY family transcriptional regulator [Gimesia maris]|uniref:BlaI/MecI/CopY family transcriptional regulator n=1 Tax=Gimesia maris TaxID=122 RepID=UPI000E89C32C|nr:BlaI/MecI/CopY family transcriptional regulator [Gimesia maris]HAW27842.1 transcriptional regulator [Planctomycetaceae bacterium]|tara:strand:- start:5035 stop:5481 length:447 start_codon:yes stop_codon:yes gene_type:complete